MTIRRANRREVLRFGLSGFSALSLGGLLRLRATSGESRPVASSDTAVILVWLRGGASHLETFDPKPRAPLEYRGPYSPIQTNVTGIQVCELLPRLASIADRYALVRSLSHTGGGHPAGTLQVLGGDPDAQDKLTPVYPDWMSVASHLRYDPRRSLPNYVAINPVDRYDNFTIAGPTYLGSRCEPFKVVGDASRPDFQVPNLDAGNERLASRATLKQRLDNLQRSIDNRGSMQAFDEFEALAINMLTNRQTRDAFDLNREPDRVRQRYGLNAWGQQLLMARRLVEAGVDVVATEFDGPLCGRVQNWDDHAVNQHIFDAMKFRLPVFDQAVAALIEDIYQRGLDRRVMVIVTGEFGRTPRISQVASSGEGVASGAAGTVQPGRDHWPAAGSMLFAGGGIPTGQVIGATDAKGEEVVQRLVGPEDFLATIYRHLSIDFRRIAIENHSGRPVPIVRSGQPIDELCST